MKREEIIEELSMRSGIAKPTCAILYETFISVMRDAILNGEEKILLKGLLTINQETVRARKGRNPSTDEVVLFPESKKISCTISKKLKNAVNGRS